jgi:hypothetical protein
MVRGTWHEADCADLVTAASDELWTVRWRNNDEFELRCMIHCRDVHSSPPWLPSVIPSQYFCCAELRSTWNIRTVVAAPVTQADVNAIRHTAGGDGDSEFLAPVSNQSLTVFQYKKHAKGKLLFVLLVSCRLSCDPSHVELRCQTFRRHSLVEDKKLQKIW